MAVQSAGSEVEVARLDAGPSLRDQAYAALKQAITSAEIYSRPDEIRLDERALTQQLGVSRTPVREAMTLWSRRASCGPSRAAACSSCARPGDKSSR